MPGPWIEKPARPRRRDRSLYAGLPLAKPLRHRDPAAVAGPRSPNCEHCGAPGPTEWHHVKTRGAGGGDERGNRVDLCHRCHRSHHDGNRPTTGELLRLAQARDMREQS